MTHSRPGCCFCLSLLQKSSGLDNGSENGDLLDRIPDFILGRSMANNPKVAIFSQPTWGVDIGAATSIRQKLLNLSQKGKAVILISQDLEEIFELSDKVCVINNGVLSDILPVNEMSASDVGLLMGANINNSTKSEVL